MPRPTVASLLRKAAGPSAQVGPPSRWARLTPLAVILVGLAVGILTCLGEPHLTGAARPLVSSAGAWLVSAFLLGLLPATLRGAAAAGIVACLLQLAAYSVTSEVLERDGVESLVLFWGACSVVGGPLLAVAGWALRRGPTRLRGLGAAVLPSLFLAETTCLYVVERQWWGSAAVWGGIGLVLTFLLLRQGKRWHWLVLTLPLGIAAEALVIPLR